MQATLGFSTLENYFSAKSLGKRERTRARKLLGGRFAFIGWLILALAVGGTAGWSLFDLSKGKDGPDRAAATRGFVGTE